MSRYTFVARVADLLDDDEPVRRSGELLITVYVEPDENGGDPLVVGPCDVAWRQESWHSWGPPERAELRL